MATVWCMYCEAPQGATARQYAYDITHGTETAVEARRMLYPLIDDEYEQLCVTEDER